MKTTLGWLREFADLPSDADEVAQVLTALGHEVEGAEHKPAPFSGVVVGTVTAIEEHPNADKLRVVDLRIGQRDHRVVCGAWNFDEGAVVAVALPGALLPRGVEVGTRDIRGVPSPGMICSAYELGLGEDREGILVLDGELRSGEDFAELLPFGDTVFDLSITTSRPDCMGTIGLARDLAAHYRVPLRTPDLTVEESGPPSEASVVIEDPSACPRFTARLVRGVTVAPSPLWMQLRLQWCGVRAINNVVDSTNYAMLEQGHPTHAFDMKRLGGSIVVRRARPGEPLTTLDGVERALDPEDLVIADLKDAVGLAGVIGGAATEVQHDTEDVLVEVAYFEPSVVLFTSKRHGLRTEASARFERGMDPDGPLRASARVTQLLALHAGGRAAPRFIDEYPNPVPPRTVQLSMSEIPRVLGTEVTRADVVEHLERLGFGISGAESLQVDVPTFRPDVTRPVDLIEEIARLHGYDRLPTRIATGTGGGLPVDHRRLRKIHDLLAGAGYHQVINYSFLGRTDLDRLALPEDDPRRSAIPVANPLRAEEGVLRTTLLPGLLRTAARNTARRVDDVMVFETGKVFLPGDGDLPEQPEHLAWVAAGETGPAWRGERREHDAGDALGVWNLVTAASRVSSRVRQAALPALHPGRGAELLMEAEVVGFAGELHPRVAEQFGLTGRISVGELDITGLLAREAAVGVRPVSPFPPAIFDLAFTVPEATAAGLVLQTIEEGTRHVESVELFDVFRGRPLPDGHKSLAFRLTLRAPDRTLAEEEIEAARSEVISAVEEAHGARLRGGER